MEKFAKVFEFHGRQILVKKGKDDEGNPKLCIITQIEGDEVDFGVCFDDDEEGWEALSSVFLKEEDLAQVAEGFAKQIIGCNTAFEVMKALQQ